MSTSRATSAPLSHPYRRCGRTHVVMHDGDAGSALPAVGADGVVADEPVLVSAEAFGGAYLDAEIDATDTPTSRTPRTRTTATSWFANSSYIKRTSSGIWSEVQTIDGGLSGQLEQGHYVFIAIHNSPWLGTTELRPTQWRPRHAHPRRRVDGRHGAHPLTVGTDYLSSMTYMDSGRSPPWTWTPRSSACPTPTRRSVLRRSIARPSSGTRTSSSRRPARYPALIRSLRRGNRRGGRRGHQPGDPYDDNVACIGPPRHLGPT